MTSKPWVSFCMSTYRRPVLLKQQLDIILRQTDGAFEIVVSDNDPEGSAREVVKEVGDDRVRYFHNETNLGMIASFNKSLLRAGTEWAIMITDDDPVVPEMLAVFRRLIAEYPGYEIYCGCGRTGKPAEAVEVFGAEDFVFQLLHPDLTSTILWSSCVLKRETALSIGGMPDYGSPHLADHAMLALCGRARGGVMINKMYSELAVHDSNFSKSNFALYYKGCKGFHELMAGAFGETAYRKGAEDVILLHLQNWFFQNSFRLKKYFTYQHPDATARQEVEAYIKNVLDLPYMKSLRRPFAIRKWGYRARSVVYYLKYRLFH